VLKLKEQASPPMEQPALGADQSTIEPVQSGLGIGANDDLQINTNIIGKVYGVPDK